jgi:hypothetical protein
MVLRGIAGLARLSAGRDLWSGLVVGGLFGFDGISGYPPRARSVQRRGRLVTLRRPPVGAEPADGTGPA